MIAMLPLGYPAEGAHPAKLHGLRKPREELVKYLYPKNRGSSCHFPCFFELFLKI